MSLGLDFQDKILLISLGFSIIIEKLNREAPEMLSSYDCLIIDIRKDIESDQVGSG